jgi:hypothetical protein
MLDGVVAPAGAANPERAKIAPKTRHDAVKKPTPAEAESILSDLLSLVFFSSPWEVKWGRLPPKFERFSRHDHVRSGIASTFRPSRRIASAPIRRIQESGDAGAWRIVPPLTAAVSDGAWLLAEGA